MANKLTSYLKNNKAEIGRVLGYSSGDAMCGAIGVCISLYYYSFLIGVMGMKTWLAALVLLIGKVWDGISDPIMGSLIDKIHMKRGNCRPWFLIGIIPLMLSHFLMWYGFGITSQGGMFAYFSFAYILYSTAYTIIAVPYEALLPRIVEDYDKRINYTSMRVFFSGVWCAVATMIYGYLVTSETASRADVPGYMWLGLVLGIFFGLPLIWTYFGTKETVSVRTHEKVTLKALYKDYSSLLKIKIYRKYFFIQMLSVFVVNAMSAAYTTFIYVVFGNRLLFTIPFISMKVTIIFLAISIVKSGFEIVMFLPNILMMKKKNKQFPYLIDLPMIVISSVIILFTNSATPVWVFVVACALAGAGISSFGQVPVTLLPDLTDVDELLYGKRREGTAASLTTMTRKIMAGIAVFVFGIILTAFGLDSKNGLSPDLATPSVLAALKLILCGIPFICSAIIVVIAISYNMDAKSHKRIKELVAEKRANGSAVLSEADSSMLEKLSGMKTENMWISNPLTEEEIQSYAEQAQEQAALDEELARKKKTVAADKSE